VIFALAAPPSSPLPRRTPPAVSIFFAHHDQCFLDVRFTHTFLSLLMPPHFPRTSETFYTPRIPIVFFTPTHSWLFPPPKSSAGTLPPHCPPRRPSPPHQILSFHRSNLVMDGVSTSQFYMTAGFFFWFAFPQTGGGPSCMFFRQPPIVRRPPRMGACFSPLPSSCADFRKPFIFPIEVVVPKPPLPRLKPSPGPEITTCRASWSTPPASAPDPLDSVAHVRATSHCA